MGTSGDYYQAYFYDENKDVVYRDEPTWNSGVYPHTEICFQGPPGAWIPTPGASYFLKLVKVTFDLDGSGFDTITAVENVTPEFVASLAKSKYISTVRQIQVGATDFKAATVQGWRADVLGRLSSLDQTSIYMY